MSNNGQKIEREMSQLRQDLEQDGRQLVESTERLKDWREHVRAYPWLSVAGAAALGLLLAPSKSKASPRSSKSNQDDEVTAAAASGTLLGVVSATVGRAAATVATRYLMQKVSSNQDEKTTPDNDSPWQMETTNE